MGSSDYNAESRTPKIHKCKKKRREDLAERETMREIVNSNIFASLKRSINKNRHCHLHHTTYQDLQEEQRQKLKKTLLQKGDWKKASALTRVNLYQGAGNFLDEPQDQDSLDGQSQIRNPLEIRDEFNSSLHEPTYEKNSHKKHRKVNKEADGQPEAVSEYTDEGSTDIDAAKISKPDSRPQLDTPPMANSTGSLSEKALTKQPSEKSSKTSLTYASSKSLLHSINPFVGSLWFRRESYSHMWITLSSMYGRFLILLMLAFCLTEVMDNKVRPLQFQGIYMMFLYVGGILAILCIYLAVLVDNCSFSQKGEKSADPEVGSIGGSLNGTLRRAHIDRDKVSRTSFYLRIGALIFGLGTLIFNGLEIAMHATMEGNCIGNFMLIHPVLQALFTFLQMHFLFINSQVIVERFGLFARFGFMHLLATNIALWIRTIIWESANDWIHYIYQQRFGGSAQASGVFSAKIPNFSPVALALRTGSYDNNYFSDRSFNTDEPYEFIENFATPDSSNALESSFVSVCNTTSPISSEHLKYVVGLYKCYSDNTLGRLWTSSMPYLFPFIVEYRVKIEVHFSLIAAAVTYVMWQNVGKHKIGKKQLFYSSKKLYNDIVDSPKRKAHWRVDCQSASKGLFLGLLCLVGGIVILILFFVMKDNPDFQKEMFWIFSGAEITILSLAILSSLTGFIQIQKLSHGFQQPYELDKILSGVTVTGAYVYGIFSILAATANGNYSDYKNIITIVANSFLIIQVTFQGMIISEASRRICATRGQQYAKPGRQLITFLLFVNATLWIVDTFMSHNWVTQKIQLDFYGILSWGIISRISLPLMLFYRFHSCVVLVEIWKNTYRTKESL